MKQRFSKRTRLVSALLTLAMVFTFLPFSAFAAEPEPVPIDADHFPDEAFRNYLLNANRYLETTKIDENGDHKLSEVERNAVDTIKVTDGYNGQKLTSLQGIEFFPNLLYLYCDENNLNSLDVSQNTALEDLICSQNNLTSLDVGNNAALINLVCWKNQLTSLDVSNNPELKFLNCDQNQLTSLNVEETNIYLSNPYSGFHAKNNTYPIPVGSDRTFDLSKLPGKFEVSKASGWVGGTVSGSTLTVDENATEVTYTYDCGKGSNTTFTLNVNVVPDGSTGGETGGGSTGGSSGGGGGGGAIIVVAGAAAVGLVGYGIYNYVAERQLQALLPEGAASPENRAQTALLLWNTAGRPEPAAQPACPDVADPDTANAAQWCVEHGLMNAKFRGRFAPDGSSPAYKTLNAYRQLVG